MESTSNTKNLITVQPNRKKGGKHKLEPKEHPRILILETEKKKLIHELKQEKERNHQLEGRVSELEALYSAACDEKEDTEEALQEVYDRYQDLEAKYRQLIRERDSQNVQ